VRSGAEAAAVAEGTSVAAGRGTRAAADSAGAGDDVEASAAPPVDEAGILEGAVGTGGGVVSLAAD
jgi:hypothetical protein